MDLTIAGLTAAEAATKLKEAGPNELPSPERRSLVSIVLEILRQPMFGLLIAGSIIYLVLGEPADAAILTLFATLSVSIGVVQEFRSERVLETLRDLASPRALVIRDGVRQRIAGRDVVPGDVVILGEGDRVPADGVLVDGHDIMADESLLTGESVPVHKRAGEMQNAAPGGEDHSAMFAGTLVTRGTGLARIAATGLHTEMGKIGRSLQTIAFEQPRLQAQLRWLVGDIAVAALVVTALVVALLGLLRGSWLQAGLGGIAIGMSMLPEEIPLVITVFMAMGAWRLSRARVLTRRAAAIETLGSATVLCTDKTGTLTENRMALELIATGDQRWRPGQAVPATGALRDILHAALGASAPIPTDPMDRAIHALAENAELHAPQSLLQSYGLRPDLFATTNLWRGTDARTAVAYAKGAPEAIAELCRLDSTPREAMLKTVNDLAMLGIRVLAVAEAAIAQDGRTLPQSQRDIPFRYLGLLGFVDPIRPTVPEAVRQCRNAGVRVVMITGDYAATAAAIASQAGIDAHTVITGDRLSDLNDADLAAAMQTSSVFARVRPQQKLRLIEALKRDGEIVAMIGDGVNDAPALKAAHIGIAMGSRGTDVAREASSLVLLDDDFASIVATMQLGRRIYDNLQKAVLYIIAVHIPIAGLAILPLLFGSPLMLMPIQIALLEMVIDPACSVVFESQPAESDVLRRPPRRPDAPVLSRKDLLWAIVQGGGALLVVAAAFLSGLFAHMAEADLRAFTFSTLVLTNIGLILVNRSFRTSLRDAFAPSNPALWILASAVIAVLALAVYWPPLQTLFHFGVLHIDELAICAGATALLVIALEAGKKFLARSHLHRVAADPPLRVERHRR